jgi:hypothetical protein
MKPAKRLREKSRHLHDQSTLLVTSWQSQSRARKVLVVGFLAASAFAVQKLASKLGISRVRLVSAVSLLNSMRRVAPTGL